MTADRLLTVAIHTYDKALEMKSLLEREGIAVVLHNVNLSEPGISSGVRVRIKEADLPLALRIIENSEIFIMPDDSADRPAAQPMVLVPVDFSTYSLKACAIAFDIAARHNGRIHLLSAYVPPARINMQLSASLDLSGVSDGEDAAGEVVADEELHGATRRRLDEFAATLRGLIKSGTLPPVKFTTEVAGAVPEDAILDIAKRRKPMIIVMGTRGAEKKERELIGSVTAEVLDSCRQPVFTVPEQSDIRSLDDIRNVTLVCNLDQNDMLALDALTRLAPHTAMDIHILHIAGRMHGTASDREQEMMLEYCRTHYPVCTFSIESIDTDTAIDRLTHLDSHTDGTSLIVVPNKKKNIIARLFNPSLAHKLLFHADIPLMAVPV